MSRRRELEQRLRRLGEIGEIMRSMKNLALMETRKLARFLDAQEASVRLFETVAADFLHHHPRFASHAAAGGQALLVVGAERGFCGDFNEELLRPVGAFSISPLLAVGTKLCAKLEQNPALFNRFEGPAVAEDVPATLNRLMPAINRVQAETHRPGLTVVHHRSGADAVVVKPLLPPFVQDRPHTLLSSHSNAVETGNPLPPGEGRVRAKNSVETTGVRQNTGDYVPAPSGFAPLTSLSPEGPGSTTLFSHPPLLNLAPERFYADLVHHYLFAALHEIFYTSLMAENQRRVQHLEGAIRRLEEKSADLSRESRTLRQEEITEEIEVILLSVEGSTPGRRSE